MKKISLFKIFLATLISIFLTFLSFMIFDFKNPDIRIDEILPINTNSDETYKIFESKLGDFGKNLKINLDGFRNLSLEIVEAKENKYEIFSNKEINLEEFLNIEFNQELNIKELEELARNKYKIIIYTKNPQEINLKVKAKNLYFLSEAKLKDLKIKASYACAELFGQESYPIEIDLRLGLVELKFEKYDAFINYKVDKGFVEIFDNDDINLTNASRGASKIKLANQKDPININIGKGLLEISRCKECDSDIFSMDK